MNTEQAKFIVENWNENGLPALLTGKEAGFILRLAKQGEVDINQALQDELEKLYDDGFGA